MDAELIANSSNPAAAKRRLMNLFSACGLEPDFTFDQDVWLPPDTENISEFLGASLGHARDVLQKAAMHTNHVHIILSELERAFGIKVNMYTGYDSYWAPSENREVADRLVKLFRGIDALKFTNQIKGVEFALDSETETCALDNNGVVYLSRKENVDEWEEFLRKLDWAKLHAQRAIAEKQEREVAILLFI